MYASENDIVRDKTIIWTNMCVKMIPGFPLHFYYNWYYYQHWFIVSSKLGNKLLINLNENITIFIHEMNLKMSCKMAVILSQPQGVKLKLIVAQCDINLGKHWLG